MKISIAMTYFERWHQLKATLNSISCMNIPKNDIEIVIVDDNSTNKIKELLKQIELNIKLIEIDASDKTWCNPCVAYNIAFSHCTGDYILIQNSECMHLGNILEYSLKNTNNNYLVFSCYSVNEMHTNTICKIIPENDYIVKVKNIILPLENRTAIYDGDTAWYQHPLYRNNRYHFCSCISKNNLDIIGGFDLRFAFGRGYDDDAFLTKISTICAIESILPINDIMTLHLFHYSIKNNISPICDNRKVLDSIRNRKTPEFNTDIISKLNELHSTLKTKYSVRDNYLIGI